MSQASPPSSPPSPPKDDDKKRRATEITTTDEQPAVKRTANPRFLVANQDIRTVKELYEKNVEYHDMLDSEKEWEILRLLSRSDKYYRMSEADKSMYDKATTALASTAEANLLTAERKLVKKIEAMALQKTRPFDRLTPLQQDVILHRVTELKHPNEQQKKLIDKWCDAVLGMPQYLLTKEEKSQLKHWKEIDVEAIGEGVEEEEQIPVDVRPLDQLPQEYEDFSASEKSFYLQKLMTKIDANVPVSRLSPFERKVYDEALISLSKKDRHQLSNKEQEMWRRTERMVMEKTFKMEHMYPSERALIEKMVEEYGRGELFKKWVKSLEHVGDTECTEFEHNYRQNFGTRPVACDPPTEDVKEDDDDTDSDEFGGITWSEESD